jgi:phosphatidylglycerol lysyltransferase
MPNGLSENDAHLGLIAWIAPSGIGKVYHSDVSGYRVAAGLPRSAPSHLSALLSEFETSCRCTGLKPLYFGLPHSTLELLDAQSARWHIGDLPVFELTRWREDSTLPANIRTQAQRARNHGVTVRHLSHPPTSAAELDSLSTVVQDWLQGKPIPPLRFLTTPFLLQPWPREGVFVAERNENGKRRVVGILIPSRALFGDVFRVDAVIRAPGAPNGCVELLVREAFRHAGARGIERATMGLAPLSRRSGVRTRGWSNHMSGIVRRMGAPWYSFDGLEAFKAKFSPDVWVPLYCVAPGRRFTIADLIAIGRAFAGGSLRKYAVECLRWKSARQCINYFRA